VRASRDGGGKRICWTGSRLQLPTQVFRGSG
jgi:hypothetical protein